MIRAGSCVNCSRSRRAGTRLGFERRQEHSSDPGAAAPGADSVPLACSAARQELHLRRIEVRGYRRSDGLYDIEARLTDTKSQAFAIDDGRMLSAGAALHDMWVRLVIDEELEVREVGAATDATPHDICPGAIASMQQLKGLRIGPGWTAAVRQRLSGSEGCTHLMELLSPMATTAYQTLSEVLRARPLPTDARGQPAKINSCYAYASHRRLIQRLWPQYFESPEEGHSAGREHPTD